MTIIQFFKGESKERKKKRRTQSQRFTFYYLDINIRFEEPHPAFRISCCW